MLSGIPTPLPASSKKQLLILITASLVDAAGNLIHYDGKK
jgi:hypothetical protein